MTDQTLQYAAAPDVTSSHSRLAIVGFVLSLFVVAAMGIAFGLSLLPVSYKMLIPSAWYPSPILFGGAVMVAWVGALVFGIAGFLQSRRKQTMAVATIVFCFIAVGLFSLAIYLEL